MAQTSPTLRTDAEISATAKAQRAPVRTVPRATAWESQEAGPSVRGREAAAGSWKAEPAQVLRTPRWPRDEGTVSPPENTSPGTPRQLQPLPIHSSMTAQDSLPPHPTKGKTPPWLSFCSAEFSSGGSGGSGGLTPQHGCAESSGDAQEQRREKSASISAPGPWTSSKGVW